MKNVIFKASNDFPKRFKTILASPDWFGRLQENQAKSMFFMVFRVLWSILFHEIFKILQNPLKSLISIEILDIHRYPLVHQSNPKIKKTNFVSNYAPRRCQNTIKIAPEPFLECQTMCRKILENSKFCDFYLIFC